MTERKAQEAQQQPRQSQQSLPGPSFPTHNSPRTWFLTAALSPLQIRLIRLLLAHGDCVVACLPPLELASDDRSADFRELIAECKSGRRDRQGWKDRIRGIRCDGRTPGQCAAAVAEAVSVFGRIDVLLCCKSDAVVGTVEELAASPVTRNLARDQFETIFFSQVNFIKAALPLLRAQHTGHVLVLTSIGGHLGTPGMPIYTSAVWALEGFCDSLAYEIAPFNVKVTIVQPHKEIQSLTNRIVFAPQLPWYHSEVNPAPSLRDMLSGALNANPDTALDEEEEEDDDEKMADGARDDEEQDSQGQGQGQGQATGAERVQIRYPRLPPYAVDRLVTETLHALTAIGGHENPPARHIVGFEGSAAVREKLKTVTEELEEFVDASLAVDFFESELKPEARAGAGAESSGSKAGDEQPSPAGPGSTSSA